MLSRTIYAPYGLRKLPLMCQKTPYRHDKIIGITGKPVGNLRYTLKVAYIVN
jgi:hypothetical protein